MTKRTIWKFVTVGTLGLLVFVFGVFLLAVAAPLFVPNTGGFVFAISRRAFSAVIVLLTVVGAALFFFARTDRRRRLN
jgi:hypothetical protein